MTDQWWLPVVMLTALVLWEFGRGRVWRLKWISIPWVVAAMSSLIFYLVLPHFHVRGDYTWERMFGFGGSAAWLTGLVAAWRLHSKAKYLTKAIEFRLAKLEADGQLSDIAWLDQRQQLEELARLIAPIGVVPGSDITTAWVEARLREMAATPRRMLQPLEIADSKRLPGDG